MKKHNLLRAIQTTTWFIEPRDSRIRENDRYKDEQYCHSREIGNLMNGIKRILAVVIPEKSGI